MRKEDFFIEQAIPGDNFLGDLTRTILNSELVGRLRQGSLDGISDLDAALALTKLVYDDLWTFGSDGEQKLDNEEMNLALRALRLLLKRLGIKLELPFRDLGSFHSYWVSQGMKGSYAPRRKFLQNVFEPILSQLDELDDRQVLGGFRGVDGELKNIIFASTGPKPEIVLQDAMNNVVEITKNAQHCLFYDRPLSDAGLTLRDMTDWWRATKNLTADDANVARHLYRRLSASLDTGIPKSSKFKPEHMIFRAYCERYAREDGQQQPALLPQVYLHYDPRTRKERLGEPGALLRERMDFLLLLPHGVRIVIELDGKQHYAEGDTASPRLYAEMVAEDRRLRLKGYEVYRFGGYELKQSGAEETLRQFFDELLNLARHRL